MATNTVENYIKQLYLQQRSATEISCVQMGQLASAMGVVPGTATRWSRHWRIRVW